MNMLYVAQRDVVANSYSELVNYQMVMRLKSVSYHPPCQAPSGMPTQSPMRCTTCSSMLLKLRRFLCNATLFIHMQYGVMCLRNLLNGTRRSESSAV